MAWSYTGKRQSGEALPFITTRIEGPTGLFVDVPAMIDTGASHTCLKAETASLVGIVTDGRVIQQDQVVAKSTAGASAAVLRLLNTNTNPNVSCRLDTDVALVPGMGLHLILGWHALQYFDLTFSRSGDFTISCP